MSAEINVRFFSIHFYKCNVSKRIKRDKCWFSHVCFKYFYSKKKLIIFPTKNTHLCYSFDDIGKLHSLLSRIEFFHFCFVIAVKTWTLLFWCAQTLLTSVGTTFTLLFPCFDILPFFSQTWKISIYKHKPE